ncbi:MAG: hypothetical protein P794_03110 [Epsilonproteobacteria bacterium (ex Lamellibrachia satsuma)]|nr:MAG: hypothetical protein P794_03110 [Epsilonproteobacteria bacterium (ex Lamellibrachia satsuma)]
MKKSVITAAAVLLGIAISGCGASGDASNGKSASESSAVAKEDVCSLLTTAEVSQLVGEAVHNGKRDTKHIYPNSSACTWTSVSHDMPLLILTYNLHAASHDLDYYAPPGNAVKKLNSSPNEAIAVLTSKEELFEVIVRSGDNAVLLTAPYLTEKEGSPKWKDEVKLTEFAAKRAKGE